MPAKNPKEVFVTLLSDARHNTERSIKIYNEVSQLAENPDVREALEACVNELSLHEKMARQDGDTDLLNALGKVRSILK